MTACRGTGTARSTGGESRRSGVVMKLLSLDSPELITLAGGWLSAPENAKWLAFGNGVPRVTPVMLKIMTQRGIHWLRVYTAGGGGAPAGVAGLSNICRDFQTGSVWGGLGGTQYRRGA